MRTALLTGFEPFGGDAANPSGEAVRIVGAGWDGPETLVTEVLPVTFAGARARLRELIDEHDPEVVVATGLAGGRATVTPERVAINLADARIPDNAGMQLLDEPVVAGGPAAHFAGLPVKAITAAMAAAGIPSSLSHSAGTFVCNHVFYIAAHEAATRRDMRAGFIHVPWARGMAPGGEPELPLGDIARALHIAVRTSLDTRVDIRAAGGAIS
ncbi:pyroglutamyl-peptidase I [Microbacterium thalassium]|uniref:Pyroglutamyl-peptidase I n=1 Tax=Microbacterium thalassium TaxID=362649 RepID=A0A7X0FPT1_9MICO|nr:pyroglutamyl-peptidase I [Microbacterium thalassium]MBB6391453.1 pyroglutamyl-peptidase [Microbacterium thalassium]GLK24154.1 pyrrolidone-carboxylate peptidase [Microbacterium thalassium]